MLLLGDDMKEWMEEEGQAEKENIPSFKCMKSDHSKIQFGTTFDGFLLIVTENILHQCNYWSICGQCQYIILALPYIKYWHGARP